MPERLPPVKVVFPPFVPLLALAVDPSPAVPIKTLYVCGGDKVNNPALYCLELNGILDNNGLFVCNPPAPPPAPTFFPPPPPPPTAKYIIPVTPTVGVIVVSAVQT
jgi:hypothetical protein